MDPLVEYCRGLAAEIQAQTEAIEAARRVPIGLMRKVAAQGLFRRVVPAVCGGEQGGPLAVLQALTALARADSAVGWCAMISVTTATFAAYLSPETAREVFTADPETITAGVFAPRGVAVAVAGGYRLTGRWEFGSHCENAAWIGLGGLIEGREFRMFMVPASEVRVVPRWDVLGLRGTGSHDLAVDEVFVAERFATGLGPTRAPMFPFFGLLALCVAAVGLGIAEASLAVFEEGARRVGPGGKPLAVRPSVQQGLAAALASHAAARAYLVDEVTRTWDAVRGGEVLDLQARARLRLTACEVVRHAVTIVDAAYHELGGSSIRDGNVLQRRFRDMHTLTQHVMVGSAARDVAARVLAGVAVDTSTL